MNFTPAFPHSKIVKASINGPRKDWPDLAAPEADGSPQPRSPAPRKAPSPGAEKLTAALAGAAARLVDQTQAVTEVRSSQDAMTARLAAQSAELAALRTEIASLAAALDAFVTAARPAPVPDVEAPPSTAGSTQTSPPTVTDEVWQALAAHGPGTSVEIARHLGFSDRQNVNRIAATLSRLRKLRRAVARENPRGPAQIYEAVPSAAAARPGSAGVPRLPGI